MYYRVGNPRRLFSARSLRVFIIVSSAFSSRSPNRVRRAGDGGRKKWKAAAGIALHCIVASERAGEPSRSPGFFTRVVRRRTEKQPPSKTRDETSERAHGGGGGWGKRKREGGAPMELVRAGHWHA